MQEDTGDYVHTQESLFCGRTHGWHGMLLVHLQRDAADDHGDVRIRKAATTFKYFTLPPLTPRTLRRATSISPVRIFIEIFCPHSHGDLRRSPTIAYSPWLGFDGDVNLDAQRTPPVGCLVRLTDESTLTEVI